MKIAACQLAVSGNIKENYETITGFLQSAKQDAADLVIFPECALTGYPPRDIPSASCVDFDLVDDCCRELQKKADESNISLLVGMVCEDHGYRNRAILFRPGKPREFYDKRALWGWDAENFIPGDENGVFHIGELTLGVRICYEVRFPEYFRELYEEKADLIAVLFYDTAEKEDMSRYQLIRAHLQTRAVENTTPIVSVNAIHPFQTAPTAVIGKSGQLLGECSPNCPGLLLYDFEIEEDSFSEKGRRTISDRLISGKDA